MKVCELIELLTALGPELEVKVQDEDYETGAAYITDIKSYSLACESSTSEPALILESSSYNRMPFTGKYLWRKP